MRIIVFVSGGGGNLKAAINVSLRKPELLQVGLVVSDRLGIRAIDIAQEYNIPVIARDFEKECGVWKICENNSKHRRQYQKKAIIFHKNILKEIKALEKKTQKKFDLVVLSYHRWIQGDLFSYFEERMINQHAGDLTIMKNDNPKERKYIGINPVLYALQAGEKSTRTSTFVVRKGYDNGEILSQGPWVHYEGTQPPTVKSAYEHELVQKEKSDWPSLSFALEGIAKGNFGLAKDAYYNDGCKIVTYKGRPLRYGGFELQ